VTYRETPRLSFYIMDFRGEILSLAEDVTSRHLRLHEGNSVVYSFAAVVVKFCNFCQLESVIFLLVL
jgi:hypothetical protein